MKLGQNFLSRIWKVLMIKKKTDKLDYIYNIYIIYIYIKIKQLECSYTDYGSINVYIHLGK